jgi:hypothetical protein
MMWEFIDRFSSEITALVDDFVLSDVDIHIDGTKPEYPSAVLDIGQLRDAQNPPVLRIRFNWDNFIESVNKFHYGLVMFAKALLIVRQLQNVDYNRKAIYQFNGQHNNCCYTFYAIEIVQRLLNLLRNDEIDVMLRKEHICEQCDERLSRMLINTF